MYQLFLFSCKKYSKLYAYFPAGEDLFQKTRRIYETQEHSRRKGKPSPTVNIVYRNRRHSRGQWNRRFPKDQPSTSRSEWEKESFSWSWPPPIPRSTILVLSATSVLYRAVQKMDLCLCPTCISSALTRSGSRSCLPRAKVERIYLNFSDPWPQAAMPEGG